MPACQKYISVCNALLFLSLNLRYETRRNVIDYRSFLRTFSSLFSFSCFLRLRPKSREGKRWRDGNYKTKQVRITRDCLAPFLTSFLKYSFSFILVYFIPHLLLLCLSVREVFTKEVDRLAFLSFGTLLKKYILLFLSFFLSYPRCCCWCLPEKEKSCCVRKGISPQHQKSDKK